MPLLVRLLIVVSCALAFMVAEARPARATSAAVRYDPPVDAPVTNPFRAPATKYGAGNRGIDYATTPGQPVYAAADGVVTFAGPVGHSKHVVVSHADGVRTTYAFVDTITTKRGARVRRGDQIATAGGSLHLSARIGDVYVDPRELFGARGVRTHLVDDDGARRARATDPAAERRALRALVAALSRTTTAVDVEQWEHDQQDCTPIHEAAAAPSAKAPGGESRRRIALLVGGLGSATGKAAILDVDTKALGYDDRDVVQFSYRGDARPYGAEDTKQDIGMSAERLAGTIRRLHDRHPDALIDVLAHSQGGLVTRTALARHELPGVATVVTLGTPHGGNRLATAGSGLARDLPETSIHQMAIDSALADELATAAPPPAHMSITAVAAATDAVVPAVDARWDAAGVRNVVIDLERGRSALDHGRLPGDPAATREIALAIDLRNPTCVTFPEWRRRQATAKGIARAQDAAAAAATAANGWLVERRPPPGRFEATRR
ncbi:MAG TPA: peptidoglycan DD-metalloendopeptidase family protein [Acidimicrobiales bacterium]|nr:peptidoglycan DD-metalloendopeptidase family protein [Acidimicrobiales bacterium]